MRWRYLILPLIALLWVACGSPDHLASISKISPKGWYAPATVNFNVDQGATEGGSSQMRILLRYNNKISADSVELIISTTAPNGVSWSDPMTIYTPKGEGTNTVVESCYRSDIRWSQHGDYRVTLQPLHIYKGISAAGVNIIYSDR